MLMVLVVSLLQPVGISASEVNVGEEDKTIEVDQQDAVDEDVVEEEIEEESGEGKAEDEEEKKVEEKTPTKNKGDPVKEEKKEDNSKNEEKEEKEENKEDGKDTSVLAEQDGVVFNAVPSNRNKVKSHGLMALKQPSKKGNKVFSRYNEGNLMNQDNGIESLGYVFRHNHADNRKYVATTSIKKDENNDMVYCLNLNLSAPSEAGIEYERTNETLTDLEYSVIYYGYEGEGDITGSWSFDSGLNNYSKDSQWKKYYITQLALYSISNDGSSAELNIGDLSSGKLDTDWIFTEKESKQVMDKIKQLTNKAKTDTKKVPKEETVEVGFSDNKVNFKYDSKTKTAKTQKLKLDVSNDKADVSLKGTLGNAKVMQDGKEVDLNTIKNGKEFHLEIPYKDIKDVNKVNIEVDANVTYKNFTKYTPVGSEGNAPNGSPYQRIAWVGEGMNTDKASLNIEYKKELGEIEVQKTSDSGKKLEGVEFTLFDTKGNEVEKKKTNKDGKVVFSALEFGNYVVKETRGLDGYVVNKDSEIEVKVNKTERYTYNVENKEIKGVLNVIKTDEDTGESLEGAKFEVFNKDDKKVGTLQTNEKGKGTIELPYGEYTVKEAKQPEGYILSDIKEDFEIKQDGQVEEFSFENKKINADVKVIKIDIDTGDSLEGVTFEVTDRDGNRAVGVDGKEIDLLVTGEDGTASVNLPLGEYKIKEVDTLDEYVLGDFEEDFEIAGEENEEDLVFEVQNKKIEGSLQVIKTDNETGDVLEGAEFEVIDSKGNVIEKITTDDKGKASLSGLEYGEYSIKEVKSPEGYKKNKEEVPFEITEDGEKVVKEIKNKKQIIKLPQSGTNMSNGLLALGVLLIAVGTGLFLGRKKLFSK